MPIMDAPTTPGCPDNTGMPYKDAPPKGCPDNTGKMRKNAEMEHHGLSCSVL